MTKAEHTKTWLVQKTRERFPGTTLEKRRLSLEPAQKVVKSCPRVILHILSDVLLTGDVGCNWNILSVELF